MLDCRFVDIHSRNTGLLRALNEVCLPVRYSERFYLTVGHQHPDTSFLLTFNDIVIGGFSTRIEPKDARHELYIFTIGVLPLFRKRGLGRLMVSRILELAKSRGCSHVYLHVHVLNKDAISFYQKVGFSIEERLDNYYKRLEEPHAFILRVAV
jgi:ribosomal protein S18 acetylase RimI-like enzyme